MGPYDEETPRADASTPRDKFPGWATWATLELEQLGKKKGWQLWTLGTKSSVGPGFIILAGLRSWRFALFLECVCFARAGKLSSSEQLSGKFASDT